MNRDKITEIRKLIEQSQKLGKSPHYGKTIKSLAKALLKSVSRTELANATGISRGTLVNWSKERTQKNKFRKLRATSAPVNSSVPLKIALPSGITIECADVGVLKNVLEQCT